MLAASMHHALTNNPPPHYPTYPSARTINPNVSPEVDRILAHALMEDNTARYQSYGEMQSDLRPLLAKM